MNCKYFKANCLSKIFFLFFSTLICINIVSANSLLQTLPSNTQKKFLPTELPWRITDKGVKNFVECTNYGSSEAIVDISLFNSKLSTPLVIKARILGGEVFVKDVRTFPSFVNKLGTAAYNSVYKGAILFESDSKNVICKMLMQNTTSNGTIENEYYIDEDNIETNQSGFLLTTITSPGGEEEDISNDTVVIANLTASKQKFDVYVYDENGSVLEKELIEVSLLNNHYKKLTNTSINKTVIIKPRSSDVTYIPWIIRDMELTSGSASSSEVMKYRTTFKANKNFSISNLIPYNNITSIVVANTASQQAMFNYEIYRLTNSGALELAKIGSEILNGFSKKTYDYFLYKLGRGAYFVKLKSWLNRCSEDGVCVQSEERNGNLIASYYDLEDNVHIKVTDKKEYAGTTLLYGYNQNQGERATITVLDTNWDSYACEGNVNGCGLNNFRVLINDGQRVIYDRIHSLTNEGRLSLDLGNIASGKKGQILIASQNLENCECEYFRGSKRAISAYLKTELSDGTFQVENFKVFENEDKNLEDGERFSLLDYTGETNQMPFLTTTTLPYDFREGKSNIIKCTNYGSTGTVVTAKFKTSVSIVKKCMDVFSNSPKIVLKPGETKSFTSVNELAPRLPFDCQLSYGAIDFTSSSNNVECKLINQVIDGEEVKEDIEFSYQDIQNKESYLISGQMLYDQNPKREELVIINLDDKEAKFLVTKFNEVGTKSEVKGITYKVAAKGGRWSFKRQEGSTAALVKKNSTFHILPLTNNPRYIAYLRNDVEVNGETKVKFTKASIPFGETQLFPVNGVLVMSNTSSAPVMVTYDVYHHERQMYKGKEWILPYAQRIIDLKSIIKEQNSANYDAFLIKLQPWNVFYPTTCEDEKNKINCVANSNKNLVVANFYPDEERDSQVIYDKRTFGGTTLIGAYDGSFGANTNLIVYNSDRDYWNCIPSSNWDRRQKFRIVVTKGGELSFDKVIVLDNRSYKKFNLFEDFNVKPGDSGQILIKSENIIPEDMNTGCYDVGDIVYPSHHAYIEETLENGQTRNSYLNVISNLDAELTSDFVRYHDEYRDNKVNACHPELPVRCYQYSGRVDSDNDGLCDTEEAVLKTNKASSDQDKDGVIDGEEVYHNFSSPKYVDTDNDGASDLEEAQNKTRAFDEKVTPDSVLGDWFKMLDRGDSDKDCSYHLLVAYNNIDATEKNHPVWFDTLKLGSYKYESITPLMSTNYGDYNFYNTFGDVSGTNLDPLDVSVNVRRVVYYRVVDLRRSQQNKTNVTKQNISELTKLYIEAYLSIIKRALRNAPCIAQDMSDNPDLKSDIDIYLVDTSSKSDLDLVASYFDFEKNNRVLYGPNYNYGRIILTGAGIYMIEETERKLAHDILHLFGLADLSLYDKDYQYYYEFAPTCHYGDFPKTIMAYDGYKIAPVDVLNLVMRGLNYSKNAGNASLEDVRASLKGLQSMSTFTCKSKYHYLCKDADNAPHLFSLGRDFNYGVNKLSSIKTKNYQSLLEVCEDRRTTIVEGGGVYDDPEYSGDHKYLESGYGPNIGSARHNWWGYECCSGGGGDIVEPTPVPDIPTPEATETPGGGGGGGGEDIWDDPLKQPTPTMVPTKGSEPEPEPEPRQTFIVNPTVGGGGGGDDENEVRPTTVNTPDGEGGNGEEGYATPTPTSTNATVIVEATVTSTFTMTPTSTLEDTVVVNNTLIPIIDCDGVVYTVNNRQICCENPNTYFVGVTGESPNEQPVCCNPVTHDTTVICKDRCCPLGQFCYNDECIEQTPTVITNCNCNGSCASDRTSGNVTSDLCCPSIPTIVGPYGANVSLSLYVSSDGKCAYMPALLDIEGNSVSDKISTFYREPIASFESNGCRQCN